MATDSDWERIGRAAQAAGMDGRPGNGTTPTIVMAGVERVIGLSAGSGGCAGG